MIKVEKLKIKNYKCFRDFEIELQKQGIPYEREKELKIQYDGVELKQNHATGYKLGLLFNFGNAEELEKERIVL